MHHPRGFEVAIPMTTYLDQRAEDPDDDPIRVILDFTVPDAVDADDHHHLLTRAETAGIARRLTEAAGQRPDVEFVLQDDGGSFAYALPSIEARVLAAALDEALRDLDAHPPREDARGVGWLEAATSNGATQRIGVDVELMTGVEGDARLKLQLLHDTWALDPEAPALASALEAAAAAALAGVPGPATFLSIEPRAHETLQEPWLTVTLWPTAGGARVALRLYDELVRDDGADGVLLFPPHGARRLGEIFRAGMALCDAVPACVERAPWPRRKVVATRAW